MTFRVSNEATSSCRWESTLPGGLTGVFEFPTKRLHPVAGSKLHDLGGVATGSCFQRSDFILSLGVEGNFIVLLVVYRFQRSDFILSLGVGIEPDA